MNVRKRGLALLMCICMIFTLLPFSALAADSDVVYGQYVNGKWQQDTGATASQTYTDKTTGANIEYSKEAKATNTPNVYDVTLTIKNTTTKVSAGASAVVLVIDTSLSMDSYSRIANAKQAAKNFAESYGATGGERYLAVVKFAGSASALNFGTESAPVNWLNVSNSANLSKVQTAIGNMQTSKSTNLSGGLSSAKSLFNDSTVGGITNFKYAVVLTDGEPNVSDVPNVWDGYEAAAQRATELKNTGCEVYTVGVSLNNKAETFLKNQVASSADKAYTTDNAADLNNIFSKIFKEIDKGITSGFTVADPMGDYAVLRNTELTDCMIANKGLTWTPKNGTSVTNSDGSTTTTYTLTYQVELDVDSIPEDGTYPLNGVTTLTFGSTTLNFNVPGVKGEVPRYDYTIKYMWGDTEIATATTGENKAGTEIPASPKSVDGYTPVSNEEQTLTISATEKNVLVFNYYKDVELVANSGTFTYDGNEKTVNGYKVYAGSEKVDVTFDGVSASGKGTDAGTYPVNFAGNYFGKVADDLYIVTKTTPGTLTIDKADTVTVTITGNTDSKVYDGTEKSVSGYTTDVGDKTISVALKDGVKAEAKGTDVGTYYMGLTKDSFVVESKNYSNIKVVVNDGYIDITPITDEVTVTITGNTDSKVYDGTEKSVSGYTTDVGDKTISVALKDGVKAEAKGTDVGTYYMGLTKDSFVVESKNYSNIKVVVNDGYIDITPITDEVTVTITGNKDTVKYDGKEHNVSGYDVEISNPLYTEDDFQFTGTASVSGTNADTHMMGLDAAEFENISNNFTNVRFVVTDGSLTITPRSITLTSGSAEKEYDGTPLTNGTVTVSGDGFVEGEGAAYDVTGSQTEVGESENTFTYELNKGTLEQNYNIETKTGKLVVTKIEAEITVVINGATDTVYYNGKEQSVTGHDWTSEAKFADKINVTLNEEGKDTAKGTRPDTYYMGLTEDDFTVTSAVYANINVVVNDGWLKINRRPVGPTPEKITVTITGNTDSKVYDGTEQNVNGYTWVSSDPSYTEKDFEFSGKADANGTYVGSYDMGITADQFKNINSRYTVEFIVETDGELKITPKPLTITAGSKEGVAPVTCDEWTATETAKGDTIVSVTITGIQPVPGESPNKASDAVIKNEAGVDVTNNYDITYVDGVLRAIEVLNKEEHFNYVIGYTDGTIRPGNNISRAEIATIFFRLLKDDVREKYMTTDCDFSDVASGAWCRRAIATLTNIGIIHGYTDGTFRPNAQITRAELATIIARFANLDVNTKTFSDITGHWAQKSIELAAGNGWINGYTDGTFRPNNKITRAETFAMINRVLDRTIKSVDDLLPQSDMNMWSDNMDESAWYYRDVQEATNYHKCDRVGDSIYEKWTAKIADIDWAVYQI